MKSHEEITSYPFTLIAGQGLGCSSERKLALQQHLFGQSKLSYAANVATGNLVAQDRVISAPDINGAIEFSYLYNSLESTPTAAWRLAAGRQIKFDKPPASLFEQATSYLYTKTPSITVTEADGHETKHILKEDGCYYPTDFQEGMPYVKLDKEKNTYIWYHPKSRFTELFDAKGNLTKRIDESGNETLYEYNAMGELQIIISPSGSRYEMRRKGQSVKIALVDTDKKETLLHSYEFENGNLKTSVTSDGYEINYTYEGDKLKQVSQSDGSLLQFGYYSSEDANKNKLQTIQVGGDEFKKNRFAYEGAKSTFIDASDSKISFKLDESQRIQDLIQETEGAEKADAIHHDYTLQGQLSKRIHPDGSEERFEYEAKSGLLNKHIRRDKTVVKNLYSYDEKDSHPILIAKIEITDEKSEDKPLAVTRYVYDTSEKNKLPLLRFEVSPQGRVKEYNYTSKGLAENEHDYLDFYATEDKVPTLTEMEQWKNAEPRLSKRISISHVYNDKGRLIKTSAGLDGGPEKQYGYDTLGYTTSLTVKQSTKESGEKYIKTACKYDDNGNLLEKTVGADSKLSQTTRHQYKANKITTTHPNKCTEVKELDSRSLVKNVTATVADDKHERKHSYERDANGRIHAETLPDSHKIISLYDKQNRLSCTVTPEGAVTKFDYNRQSRYQKKTEYATTVDASNIEDLESLGLSVDDENDRTSYTFFGLNDETRFTVDAEDHLIEHQYDSLGNLSKIINYAEKISEDELEKLKTGKEPTRKPSRICDQITSYFYDADGKKIGEQNPLGFVTKFDRDGAGRVIKEIRYSTKCLKLSACFEEIIPAQNKVKDAHTCFFYNSLNQCVLEVDAEGYITTHSYFPDGQKQCSARYETPVEASWENKSIPPIPTPSKNENDQTTNYSYDDVGRLEEIKKSSGEIVKYKYDEMNNRTESYSLDTKTPLAVDTVGDLYRGNEYKYDGWGQVITEADSLVKESLIKLSLGALSDLDKQAQISEIWNQKSKRNQYNEVGLKIKSTDPVGHTTLNYYDKVGNLVLTIDATGAVSENSYNAFKELNSVCRYYNRLALENVSSLSGGYITEGILKLIKKDPSHDAVTTFKRDKRGNITKKIDPESNTSIYQYNAFQKCVNEILPVASNISTLEITHEYDAENHEIKTTTKQTAATTSAPDEKISHTTILSDHFSKTNEIKSTEQTIIVEKKYDHFSGNPTETTNALGARTLLEMDKLGRVKKIDQEVKKDIFITESDMKYDSFSYVTEIVNADKQTTIIEHRQKERTRIIHSPIVDSKDVIKENIFGETIEKLDGEANKETIRHASDGQITEHKIGEQVTTAQYNLLGFKEEETDATKIKTKFTYNAANQLKSKIEDADEKGLNLTIRYEPNAFGCNETEIDSRGIESKNEFNRCGGLIKKISDPNGKVLITQYERNAQGSETHRIYGDEKVADQMHIATEYDAFNRTSTKIVDPKTLSRSLTLPEALDIRTQFQRDAAGNIIKETDPKGSIKRSYYDLRNRKNFELKSIDPTQYSLTEWTYTGTGKVSSVRSYFSPMDAKSITDLTILDDLNLNAKSDKKNDAVTLYYYDAKDREKFVVTLVWNENTKLYNGIVVEKQYNKANKEIGQISYHNTLNAEQFAEWTTEKLTSLVVPDEKHDRASKHWYNKESQIRFTINQDGLIKERRCDTAGRPITEISYSRPVSESKGKTTDDLIAEVEKLSNPLRDQVTHRVYDSCGREIFTVNPDGAATRKDYDENSNVISVCQFKDRIPTHKTYEALVSSLKALVPNKKIDAVTDTEYDKLGFVKSITDALDHKDIFERNVLGNLKTHTDREKNIKSYVFDRANRLIEEITPKTKIAIVAKDDKGKLIFTEKETTITKKTDFDKAGNTTRITDGIVEGSSQEEKFAQSRVFQMDYDSRNKLTETSQPKALIDDDTKHGDLALMPVKSATLTTNSIWNTMGKKVVDKNEAGLCSFKVHDNAGRLLFAIDEEKCVTEYSYNSFDQPTQIIQYATKLEDDLSPYNEIGLIPATFTQALHLKKSSDDRIKTLEYNRSGKLEDVKSGPVFYYSDGKSGLAQPETKKEFSPLGDCVKESRLISPDVWSSKLTWYDSCNRIIAEVNENNFLTRYVYNTVGKVELKTEFATALSVLPTVSTLVDELKSVENEKDRIYKYEYDLLNQKITEITRNIVTEKLVLDEKSSVPHLETLEKTNSIRRWEYSPTQKETALIHEDGSNEKKYYDSRGIKIAETQVSRQSVDDTGKSITLTPLTVLKPNAFGQTTVTQKSTKGGSLNGSVPELITTSPADLIQEVLLHDDRGLVKLKQDAEENLKGFTYTPSRKVARELSEISLWKKDPSSKIADEKETKSPLQKAPGFIKEKHLDEKLFKYNKRDQTIQLTLLRDRKIEEEKTHSQYNAFGDLTGQGKDGVTWEITKKMDTNGSAWFSNHENGGSIKLYDLRGAETLQFQSIDTDLSLINYNIAELSNLLAIDSKSLERTETIRDASAHVTARKFPIWFKDKKPLPTRAYIYDRWGNIINETDSFNNQTDSEYNHRDQLKKRIQPEVLVAEVKGDKLVLDEKGNFQRKRPITLHGHDVRGFEIGTTDANNHTSGFILDESGQWVVNILADGTREESRVLNAVGYVTSITDARGKRHWYEHNRLGKITVDHPPLANGLRRFGYNEKGHRIIDIDALGNAIRYNYDIRGNVIENYLPLGQCTKTSWDRNGQKLVVVNADGDSISWERDYFGLAKNHKDLENRIYVYANNFKKQLKHQSLATGVKWGSVEPENKISFPPADVKGEFPAVNFAVKFGAPKAQDIIYTYAYGLPESVLDNGLGKLTTYEHDSESRRELLEIRTSNSDNTLLYRISTKRDELGRESSTTDKRLAVTKFYSTMTTTQKYDAVSNLVNINMALTAAGFSADCKVEPKINDSWNLFDDADRVRLSNGILTPQCSIQLAPLHGLELKHEHGFRTQEKTLDAKSEAILADILFDDNGNLKSTISAAVKDEVSSSEAGYPDYYCETSKGQKTERKAQFNENGWQQEEVTTDPVAGRSTLFAKDFLQSGVPQTEIFRDEKSGITDTRRNGYLRTNTLSLNKVVATRSTKDGTSQESIAEFCHDANGTLNGKFNSLDELFGGEELPSILMDTTHDGWIMDKQSIAGKTNRQTNFSRNIHGELLAGYTSGYLDSRSLAPRPIILRWPYIYIQMFHPDLEDGLPALEQFLTNSAMPYSNGIYLHGVKAVYFVNRKLLRNAQGNVIIATTTITTADHEELPVNGQLLDIFNVIERNRSPWVFDRVMNKALSAIGLSQADFMQIEHQSAHKIGKDVKPDVSDIAIHSIIHPVARTSPTDRTAKNNPLNWDEPTLMQQLGQQAYIVNSGDTFKSIAKRFGGDIDAAEKIASLNGFSISSHELKPEIMLRIPQIIPSKNKAETARPDHDFMRVVTGSLSPPLVTPMPPLFLPQQHKRHHSFFGVLIKIIAIAIVCAAAPHLAAFLLPMVTGAGSLITAGVIAALGDAVVQKAAISLHAQDSFSFAEMLETGVTVGVGGTLKHAKDLEQLAKNALIIGTAAVATQLGELATGLRSKFDTSAIFIQVAASIAAAKINDGIDGVLAQGSTLSSAIKSIAIPTSNALLGSAITHTPMDIQSIAANAMGTAIGSEVGSHIGESLDLKAPGIRPASQSLKPDITDVKIPSTAIDANDPRWHSGLSEMSSRQRQANLAQPEVKRASHSYLLDPDKQVKYRNMIFGGSHQSSSSASLTHGHESTLAAGLQTHVVDAYKSPASWSAASIEKLSETTKNLGVEYQAAGVQRALHARKVLNLPVRDVFAAEAGSDIGRSIANRETVIASDLQYGGRYLSKFSMLAKGGAVGLDVISKGIDVAQAPTGTRARTAFVKGAELIGEMGGTFVGGVVVAGSLPESLGSSLIAAPAIIVGSSAAGGYLLGHLAENIENGIDYSYDYLSKKRGR